MAAGADGGSIIWWTLPPKEDHTAAHVKWRGLASDPAAAAAAAGGGNGDGEAGAEDGPLHYSALPPGLQLHYCLQQYIVSGVARSVLGQALFTPAAVLHYAVAAASLFAAAPAVPEKAAVAMNWEAGCPHNASAIPFASTIEL